MTHQDKIDRFNRETAETAVLRMTAKRIAQLEAELADSRTLIWSITHDLNKCEPRLKDCKEKLGECQQHRDGLADALEAIMAGRFVIDEVPGTDEWLQDPEAPKQPGGMLYIKSVEIINDAEAALASVRGE